MTRFARLLTLLFAVALAQPAAAACRQALAMGLDVSGSVDEDEYRLQLDGLAAALTDPDVARAILATPATPVRLLVYEWSGPTDQRLLAGWREITDAAALEAFADGLRTTRRRAASPSTALGAALVTGATFLAEQRDCWTRTLDISGDGMSNTGPRPQDLDHVSELSEITVNALAIGRGEGGTLASASDLGKYFERLVIRGPGAFVEHAEGFPAYRAAMTRKLLRELGGVVVGALDRPGGQ